MDTGKMSMEQGDYSQAVESFSRAIEENPSNAVAYFLRGAAYTSLNDREKAEGDYNKACELGIHDACKEATIMKDERDLKMQLAYSILDDAVDLVPATLQKMITPQDSLDEAMKGAREFGKDDQLPKPLLSAAYYGAVVAYVVRELYGEEVQDFYIPQAVYYNGFSKVDNLKKAFAKAKNTVKISKMSDRDRYNEAFSLTINIWINHTPRIKKTKTTLPKEGVYLRDNDDKLYLYSGVPK